MGICIVQERGTCTIIRHILTTILPRNIYLKQTNNIIFLGTSITSNNSKINGTTVEGVIESDYTPGVKITRWYI
jgi:hypothetical protein